MFHPAALEHCANGLPTPRHGQPSAMASYQLWVSEDCAQVVGAGSHPVGRLAHNLPTPTADSWPLLMAGHGVVLEALWRSRRSTEQKREPGSCTAACCCQVCLLMLLTVMLI